MALLKMGVIGTSKKVDERRVPIHPEHIKRIPENIRKQLIFEKEYEQNHYGFLMPADKTHILESIELAKMFNPNCSD